MKLKIADICCGIGGLRLGFEKALVKDNLEHECVFACDINENARITYKANFNQMPRSDINTFTAEEIPEHDILLSGFPCQPFSTAGKKLGVYDNRVTPLFKLLDIMKSKQPKIVLFENVPGIIHVDNGKLINKITTTMEKSNYETACKTINGLYFVPQNRRRIYIIGIRKDIIKRKADKLVRIAPQILQNVTANKKLVAIRQTFYKRESPTHIKVYTGYCYTLTASMYTSGSIPYVEDENGNFRKLVFRECARLMGIPDDFKFPVKDIEAYRLIGNSVIVTLITEIAKNILDLRLI